jgi:hypothetical protein
MRRLDGPRIVVLFLVATSLGACSESGALPPFSTQVVGPEGGTFELTNGFGLIVPPGALDEATPLSLRKLTDAEKAALANNDRLLPKRFLGGFFAEPEGVEFLVPIQIVVPLEQDLNPGGLPLVVTADHRNRSYVAPTCLTHDPEARRATLALTHFSYWAEVEAELARAAAECSDPATACRCGAIHVETEATDFSSGECQSVSDTVRVTFLDCPGQPTEESTLTDETAGCDEEDDTGGGGGGDDPCEGELWAIAQEYVEAWHRLVHFGSTWEMVVREDLVMPAVHRYRTSCAFMDDDHEVWFSAGEERVLNVTTVRFTVPELQTESICGDLRSVFGGSTYEELEAMFGEEGVREEVGGVVNERIASFFPFNDGMVDLGLEAQTEIQLSLKAGDNTIRRGRFLIQGACGDPSVKCWEQWPCEPGRITACPSSIHATTGQSKVEIDLDSDLAELPIGVSLRIRGPYDLVKTIELPTRESTSFFAGYKTEDPCEPPAICCPVLTEPTCGLNSWTGGCTWLVLFLDPESDWSAWMPNAESSVLTHYPDLEPDEDPLLARWVNLRRSQRLRCVEKCECRSPDDAICDDQNPCTVDSCALPAGVCRHEPVPDGPLDDESPSDCLDRYCIGGEPAGMADDSEVPEQDEPGDCHRMACVDGEPTGLSDDADAPPDLPGDCIRVLCHDGEAAGVPADDETPAQASPTDCLRQICLDGEVITVPAPEEPGC